MEQDLEQNAKDNKIEKEIVEDLIEFTFTNLYGLHGNAILSRCPLRNAKVFREPLRSEYYSHKKRFINANEFEKRLGGRIGLIAESYGIKIASIHTLENSEMQQKFKASLMNSTHNVKAIVAGDHHQSFCRILGLEQAYDKNINTWPASCTSFGHGRGDIICSNARVVGPEIQFKPCVNGQLLSDHAILALDIEV